MLVTQDILVPVFGQRLVTLNEVLLPVRQSEFVEQLEFGGAVSGGDVVDCEGLGEGEELGVGEEFFLRKVLI